MKASVKNYRQSPRKVRLVADLVRGKRVPAALVELDFLPKRASQAISKLISSAAANAGENFKTDANDLIVKEIRVDQGMTLKRIRPRSRGMAHRINKRTSNIMVTLGQKGAKQSIKVSTQKEEDAVEKKAPAKKTAKKAPAKKTTAKKAPAKKSTKKTTKKES
jgi:large subunit ribosomal protein L22